MVSTAKIFSNVLEKINPSKEELNSIKKVTKEFKESLELEIKKLNIEADVFVGGSFAKGTLIKKRPYDVDVFVRFEKKDKDISDLTEKILSKVKIGKKTRIHGSRDYFKADVSQDLFFEIIPVLKISRPKEAENITDLSYFHVGYVKRKLNTQKLLDETKITKAFCHATKCYGAESYISGFSGYAIELLINHYKSFMKFLNAVVKMKERIFIDTEKMYKSKLEISMNMNSAKMNSPIVIIDPTYRERNALAALSEITFKKFQKECERFLRNPSEEMFETKDIDAEKIKKSIKGNAEFAEIILETDRQEGDIAGSKLQKFYRHLLGEFEKSYKIEKTNFEYSEEKEAKCIFVVKKKDKILFNGPDETDKKNVAKFKKMHKTIFSKKGRLYAEEKITKNVDEFVKDWKSKNCEKIREMGIVGMKIVN